MFERIKTTLEQALEIIENLPKLIDKLFDALDRLVVRLFLWALAAYGAYLFFTRHP